MGSITSDTPRDTTGRRKRDVPEDVIVDIVARRVMNESLAAISKATGVPRSTVGDLLHKPDVIAMVKAEQDAIAAIESAQADVLREAKRREQSREASKRLREAKAAARAEATPAKPEPKKKGLTFARFGWDDRGEFGFSVHGSGSLEGETRDEWLVRSEDERNLAPYPLPIRVHFEGRTGPGMFGLDLLDPKDVAHRAGQLAAEGFGDPDTIAETLRKVKPGKNIILRFEQPAPEDSEETL